MLRSAVAPRVASRHADCLARSVGAGGPLRALACYRCARAAPHPAAQGSVPKREDISSKLEGTFSLRAEPLAPWYMNVGRNNRRYSRAARSRVFARVGPWGGRRDTRGHRWRRGGGGLAKLSARLLAPHVPQNARSTKRAVLLRRSHGVHTKVRARPYYKVRLRQESLRGTRTTGFGSQ